ncbi:DnaD domain protein [Gemella sp.]
MININIKGLLVDADFLMNYTSHNLSGEEAMFLLQISYLTNQGKIPFSIDLFKSEMNKSENEIFSMLDNLINKGSIVISPESKIKFSVFDNKDTYYTLRELLKLVERVTGRILTSKEIDIVTSWFEKQYTKVQIDEALTLSKNINYVNGILNNKLTKEVKTESGSSLGYDWFNK